MTQENIDPAARERLLQSAMGLVYSAYERLWRQAPELAEDFRLELQHAAGDPKAWIRASGLCGLLRQWQEPPEARGGATDEETERRTDMTLGKLMVISGMLDSGSDVTLHLFTESDLNTVLECKADCPLLLYLKDIEVESFEPCGLEPGVLEVQLCHYRGWKEPDPGSGTLP